MAIMNRALLMGTLTQDPVMYCLPSGTPACTRRLDVKEAVKAENGEMTARTESLDVEVWGSEAENCQPYLSRGSEVLVESSLQMKEWTNERGEQCSCLVNLAHRVQLLGQPNRAQRDARDRRPEAKPSSNRDDSYDFGAVDDQDNGF